MTKNFTIDKVKLIMQAGIFNTMNDAISKFVNSCTEAIGQPNTVPYYKNYPQRGGNRGRGNYRANFRSRNKNYNNNSTQNNTGRGQYRGTCRGRGKSSRGHNNNNQNIVRVTNSQTNSTSGNSQNPLVI